MHKCRNKECTVPQGEQKFTKCSASSNGLNSVCKECLKLRRIANKEKRAESKKRKYLEEVTDTGVYIISDGELTKIGITTNITKRMLSLQSGNGRKLDLVMFAALGEKAIAAESYLHGMFAYKKCVGEWFNLTHGDVVTCKEYISCS